MAFTKRPGKSDDVWDDRFSSVSATQWPCSWMVVQGLVNHKDLLVRLLRSKPIPRYVQVVGSDEQVLVTNFWREWDNECFL